MQHVTHTGMSRTNEKESAYRGAIFQQFPEGKAAKIRALSFYHTETHHVSVTEVNRLMNFGEILHETLWVT
jgi:hypothetical protein